RRIGDPRLGKRRDADVQHPGQQIGGKRRPIANQLKQTLVNRRNRHDTRETLRGGPDTGGLASWPNPPVMSEIRTPRPDREQHRIATSYDAATSPGATPKKRSPPTRRSTPSSSVPEPDAGHDVAVAIGDIAGQRDPAAPLAEQLERQHAQVDAERRVS